MYITTRMMCIKWNIGRSVQGRFQEHLTGGIAGTPRTQAGRRIARPNQLTRGISRTGTREDSPGITVRTIAERREQLFFSSSFPLPSRVSFSLCALAELLIFPFRLLIFFIFYFFN